MENLQAKKREIEIELLQLAGWRRVPGEFEAWTHPQVPLNERVFSLREALEIESAARGRAALAVRVSSRNEIDAAKEARAQDLYKRRGLRLAASYFGGATGFEVLEPKAKTEEHGDTQEGDRFWRTNQEILKTFWKK